MTGAGFAVGEVGNESLWTDEAERGDGILVDAGGAEVVGQAQACQCDGTGTGTIEELHEVLLAFPWIGQPLVDTQTGGAGEGGITRIDGSGSGAGKKLPCAVTCTTDRPSGDLCTVKHAVKFPSVAVEEIDLAALGGQEIAGIEISRMVGCRLGGIAGDDQVAITWNFKWVGEGPPWIVPIANHKCVAAKGLGLCKCVSEFNPAGPFSRMAGQEFIQEQAAVQGEVVGGAGAGRLVEHANAAAAVRVASAGDVLCLGAVIDTLDLQAFLVDENKGSSFGL